MTDAEPRPRRTLRRRVMWGLLILCGIAAAWIYEVNAFSMAARADADRRGVLRVAPLWPMDVYEPTLQRARNPRAAEEAMPDEDGVEYFLVDGPHGQVLRQVFHVRLRQGPRSWRRQMTVVWDGRAAPHLSGGEVMEPSGERLSREQAFAWYDAWLARERAWRRDNAERLQVLVTALALVGGTYSGNPHGTWILTPDSAELYRAHLASIYRFGEEGVQALVNCLGDSRPTSTRAVVDGAARGPVLAGTICHHILKDMVEFEGSIPEGDVHRFGTGGLEWEWVGELDEPADAARLAAGEAAWRARMAGGEYHFVRS